MSVFTRKDPRLLACADPSWPAALWATLRRHAIVASAIVLVVALAYTANIVLGFHAAAQAGGTMNALPVISDVSIIRDRRGIPHIRARNLHDAFFAQGFVEASDRLFEMDLTRRYAYGTLSEAFGARTLWIDERMRAADIRGIAQRQWRGSDAATRAALQAFSDGVNAAETRQPLPVEFRMALYRPAPWTPQDSIAVSAIAALELGDSWYDVLSRDDRWRSLGRHCYDLQFPLSDPRYDVSVDGRMLRTHAPGAGSMRCEESDVAFVQTRTRPGSNAWAAGAQRTIRRHALIANDPHVDLTIPGIWYAIDVQAPGLHAAGAVIPGLPGVALGHNERIAWAVTNAEVATSVVYRADKLPKSLRVVERFGVRFGSPVTKVYYRTPDAFSIESGEDQTIYLVRWPAYVEHRTSISTLLALDRAHSIGQAMHALAGYRGAPQNFIVAGSSGAIAYHLAGAIPDDPAWGRYAHPARDLAKPIALIPFAQLPSQGATRSGVLLTANNRAYGPEYRYRLSAAFEPPYRAYRIAQLLHARREYDAAYFERMQMDACSPIDAEIARDIVSMTRTGDIRNSRTRTELARWSGCYTPASKAATLEHDIRDGMLQQSASLGFLLAQLRSPADPERTGWEETAAFGLRPIANPQAPWRKTGAVRVEHPMSAAWYGLLRGTTLPGNGDEYTIHLQEPDFAQGFRAVWEVGDWDAGGIVLPSGESGEPGSGHYDDLAKTWIRGTMVPLPFSARAIARDASATLLLTARR